MTFDSLAKDLLRERALTPQKGSLERAGALIELAAAGFSRPEIFSEIRDLYDNCDDPAIKRQLLDMVVKVHGLYKEDEKREAPVFIFNIAGDKEKINTMLCPPHPILEVEPRAKSDAT